MGLWSFGINTIQDVVQFGVFATSKYSLRYHTNLLQRLVRCFFQISCTTLGYSSFQFASFTISFLICLSIIISLSYFFIFNFCFTRFIQGAFFVCLFLFFYTFCDLLSDVILEVQMLFSFISSIPLSSSSRSKMSCGCTYNVGSACSVSLYLHISSSCLLQTSVSV